MVVKEKLILLFNVVSEELYGAGVNNDYIDTLLLSRQHLQNIKSHSLSSLCQYFNIDTSGAHRALVDCEMTNSVCQALSLSRRTY